MKRLMTELKMFNEERPSGSTAELIGDNLYKWIIKIPGPVGSIYEGPIYKLECEYPQKYPHDAPKFKFVPPIYHPNVDPETGEFCMMDTKWAPATNTKSLISAAVELLAKPNNERPRNPLAAAEFANQYPEFVAKVKTMVSTYK